LIAARSDCAALGSFCHGLSRANSAGTVRSVKRLGSNPERNCGRRSGIDTVAPGRARGDSGATAVAMRSLRG